MTRLDRWIDGFIRRIRDDPTIRRSRVGPVDDPFMDRYFVLPRNRVFNIYLHYIHKSDVGELHDHRMASVSVILQGHYYEQRFVSKPVLGSPLPLTTVTLVKRLHPVFRLPSTPHRLLIEWDGETGKPVPAWSLFFGFPHVRNWGFYTEKHGEAQWLPHDRAY